MNILSQSDLIVAPPPLSVFYETELVYVALASYPISKGHTVVVWKKKVADLGQMSPEDYTYLMLTVDKIRTVLMHVFKVKKVYLMYMDEVKHVHWHLIPRYSIFGLTILKAQQKQLKSFSLVPQLQKALSDLDIFRFERNKKG